MRGVLVDTSVWVEHFQRRNGVLVELLGLGMVMAHPLVVGELACGSPRKRLETLADLAALQQTEQASVREAMGLIERESLFGPGCGLVDLLLLSSVLLTAGTQLWMLDRRLGALADRFGVMHLPALH